MLLGPPGSGKTTLLRALAGKSDNDLKVCFICALVPSLSIELLLVSAFDQSLLIHIFFNISDSGSFPQITGRITYCGHEFKEFVAQRTSAYISQSDLHHGEMTVRETLDFSGRCLGVGSRYEMLAELSRREKEAGIKPDPEIDAFMKAISMSGQKTSLITDYVLKVCCSHMTLNLATFIH